MLAFFRKYERYLYAVITVMIVISFTFFGTYQTMQPDDRSSSDHVVFHAVDGSSVSSYELNQMVYFLGTDFEDKILFGGRWGPNFLNDGVIKQDFLMAGLADMLAEDYMGELRDGLMKRHAKEKRFTPYVHPQAPFLSAEATWELIVPEIKANFAALRSAEDPTTTEAFATRVRLYLAEKTLPAPRLRQAIRLQERNYNWLTPDPNLERTDLSLFEYHTVEDWFGRPFIQLVAEFIINAAKIAQQKGYEVSEEEALVELITNAEISFKQNRHNPYLGVTNSGDYMREQLRRMGISQHQAIKTWQQVMLFRRYFIDAGRSAFVDPLTFQNLHSYAKEVVQGDLYQLPEKLHFANYRMLQKFEFYLDAVARRPEKGMERLQLPKTFLSAEEVTKKYPELVQKRYLLEIADVDKDRFQAKVPVKQAWDWEVEEDNWERLKEKFPELGIKKGETQDERFVALESLDNRTRHRVDAFARAAIVEEHPEWLQEALEKAPKKKMVIGLRRRGGISPFVGLERREELMDRLDEVAIGEKDPELADYSADSRHHYRIVVLDRKPDLEVLTFAEADEAGILDEILDRQLEVHYLKIRRQNASLFQQPNGSWKPLQDVRDRVADDYFANTLEALRSAAPSNQAKTGDALATLRFYPHLLLEQKMMQNDPERRETGIRQRETESQDLPEQEDLIEQWKLTKKEYRVERGGDDPHLDKEKLFAMEVDSWSPVRIVPNGDLTFFHVKERDTAFKPEELETGVNRAYQLISNDVQKVVMRDLLEIIKEKNAIVLEKRSD